MPLITTLYLIYKIRRLEETLEETSRTQAKPRLEDTEDLNIVFSLYMRGD